MKPRYRIVSPRTFAVMVLAGEARLPWMPGDDQAPNIDYPATLEQTVAEWLRRDQPFSLHEQCLCIGLTTHRDGLYRIIGSDGGEPEDQTFGRNWAWVAPALEAAYCMGFRACEIVHDSRGDE